MTYVRKLMAAQKAHEVLARDTREAAAQCGFELRVDPAIPNRPATVIAPGGDTYSYPSLRDLLAVWTFVRG